MAKTINGELNFKITLLARDLIKTIWIYDIFFNKLKIGGGLGATTNDETLPRSGMRFSVKVNTACLLSAAGRPFSNGNDERLFSSGLV